MNRAFQLAQLIAVYAGIAVVAWGIIGEHVAAWTADNSSPYITYSQTAVTPVIVPGQAFAYAPRGVRRQCAKVTGSEIVTGEGTERRELWSTGLDDAASSDGTVPIPEGTVWTFKDTQGLKTGAYVFRWCGSYEGCSGASKILPFCSPDLTFQVVEPQPWAVD